MEFRTRPDEVGELLATPFTAGAAAVPSQQAPGCGPHGNEPLGQGGNVPDGEAHRIGEPDGPHIQVSGQSRPSVRGDFPLTLLGVAQHGFDVERIRDSGLLVGAVPRDQTGLFTRRAALTHTCPLGTYLPKCPARAPVRGQWGWL